MHTLGIHKALPYKLQQHLHHIYLQVHLKEMYMHATSTSDP